MIRNLKKKNITNLSHWFLLEQLIKPIRHLHYRSSWKCRSTHRHLILVNKFWSCIQEYFLLFLDMEWNFVLCHRLHPWLFMLCILVCSSRNTSSYHDTNIWFPRLNRNSLDILVGIWIGIMQRNWISHICSLPLRNQLQTLFDIMVKIFTI